MRKFLLKSNKKVFYSTEVKIYKHYNDYYEKSKSKVDLIVVNSPNFPFFFKNLWSRSDTKICADGGSNRLFEYSKDLIPTVICGDLDSARESVKTYYNKKGTKIVQNLDQNTNDLDKTLSILKEMNSDYRTIVVSDALGGRLDQTM
eukprot:gene11858-5187_t